MQTVRKKNVPSGKWSKFLYIFYRLHFNFETKMRFLCKEQKLVLWRLRLFFFRFCVDVCRAVTMRRERNRHDYFKWIQSSLERKKKIDLSSLVYGLKRTFHQEILCLSRAATARKSDQKACAIMHVQSFRVIFCLLKTIALIFWLC